MTDLIGLLPRELNYAESPEMTAIQNALTAAMGDVWAARDGFAAQLSPATATWGLDMWEEALGLVARDRSDFDARRRAVIARLRGAGTSTMERFRSVAETCLGGVVWVREFPGEYRVEIRVRSMAVPEDGFAALTKELKEIMPAHLRWSYGMEYPAVASTLHLGGGVGGGTSMGIPEAPDMLDFRDTLRAGVTFALAGAALPVPENPAPPTAATILRTGGVCTIISNLSPEGE